MIKPKPGLKNSNRDKIILLLSTYIILTEFMKLKAEIYILEQSLESKLILFSLAVLLLYDVSYYLIVVSIIVLLLLSMFNKPTGFMVYVLVFYAFIKLLKSIKKTTFS